MQITKIVITGAPCSGKTTVINKLLKHYENKGVNVFLCPETATVVLDGGFDRADVPAFEQEIARVQQISEQEIEKKAKTLGLDNILILCDRGLTDCFSYVKDRKSFEKRIGIDVCSAWSRYDAVIMLQTTAVNGYIENNAIRTESVEDAVQDEKSLLDVYVGHPHLRFIKTCDSIDEKTDRTIAQIDTVLNNIELEKKYLIEYPDLNALCKYRPVMSDISQTYLLCDNGSHRVRKRTTNGSTAYFETLKIRITGSKAEEYENIITQDEYNKLLKSADPDKNTIVKQRYCFLYDAQYFELDVFPFWKDKAFLELELTGEDDRINLPPEIKIIKDVSDDPKYKNNYLARLKL